MVSPSEVSSSGRGDRTSGSASPRARSSAREAQPGARWSRSALEEPGEKVEHGEVAVLGLERPPEVLEDLVDAGHPRHDLAADEGPVRELRRGLVKAARGRPVQGSRGLLDLAAGRKLLPRLGPRAEPLEDLLACLDQIGGPPLPVPPEQVGEEPGILLEHLGSLAIELEQARLAGEYAAHGELVIRHFVSREVREFHVGPEALRLGLAHGRGVYQRGAGPELRCSASLLTPPPAPDPPRPRDHTALLHEKKLHAVLRAHDPFR